jgi:hypothetical protein
MNDVLCIDITNALAASRDDFAATLLDGLETIDKYYQEGLLTSAILHGCPNSCRVLVTKSKHKATKNWLFYAISTLKCKVELDVVTALVQGGAAINMTASDLDPTTPLGLAIRFCEHDIAALLVKHGANVNCVDDDNKTPIYTAACHFDTKLVALLIAHGANVNKRAYTYLSGPTPVWAAATRKDYSTVALLIAHGANVYLRCSTPSSIGMTLPVEVAAPSWTMPCTGAFRLLLHVYIVDITLTLSLLELPAYVLLWIFDWLPIVADSLQSEFRKITLITNVVASIRRLREARERRMRERGQIK